MQWEKGRGLSEGEKKIEKYIYSMNHLLGKGSYASVFLGRLVSDGTPAAVKVIDKRIFSNHHNLKNIHSQIEIMKKLTHDNIVRLYDVYQTANNMYIVTQFCQEGDLRAHLQRHKILSEADALNFLKDILRAFQYLCRLGVTHRDLKPANILIQGGKLKVSDFGFARSLQSGDNTVLKSIVGTPLYMSPQILTHQTYTNKSDLWSVGLIYYEMLHGYTPWPASNELQLINAINQRPVVFGPHVSEKSRDFIRSCLRKKEDQRMSWEEAFSHPLLSDSPLTSNLKDRDQKENRTPRRQPLKLRQKDKNRSKSRSISATKASNLSRTPRRSKLAVRNFDVTPDRKSPWKI